MEIVLTFDLCDLFIGYFEAVILRQNVLGTALDRIRQETGLLRVGQLKF